MNRTLQERAKCMLFDADLDKPLWAEAINMAAYLTNRMPNRTLGKRVPERFWSEGKLDLSSLKIFGTPVMVHVPKEKRRKWDAKSKPKIFVGCSERRRASDAMIRQLGW